MKKLLFGLTFLMSVSSLAESENAISHLPDSNFSIACTDEEDLIRFEIYNDTKLKLGDFSLNRQPVGKEELIENTNSFSVRFKKSKFFSRAKTITFEKKTLDFNKTFTAKNSAGETISCAMHDELFKMTVTGVTSQIQWYAQGGNSDTVIILCKKLADLIADERYSQVTPAVQDLGHNVYSQYCE